MFDPPPTDPREQPVDMRVSALYAPELPTQEQLAVLDGQEALSRLMLTYGAKRVQRWLRNLAAIYNQEID